MRLALYQPDIPQNTGTILRMAACLSIPVDVIGPAGFDLTDRALRRAALDYYDHADITRYCDFETYLVHHRATGARLILTSSHATETHVAFSYRASDTLLFGRESAGVPDHVHAVADCRVRIPIRVGLRSLNIAVAAAVILGEALRQTSGFASAAANG